MHFAIEFKEQDGRCLKCDRVTELITPDSLWYFETDEELGDDAVEIEEEITAHYCTTCKLVTGIWIKIIDCSGHPEQKKV